MVVGGTGMVATSRKVAGVERGQGCGNGVRLGTGKSS